MILSSTTFLNQNLPPPLSAMRRKALQTILPAMLLAAGALGGYGLAQSFDAPPTARDDAAAGAPAAIPQSNAPAESLLEAQRTDPSIERLIHALESIETMDTAAIGTALQLAVSREDDTLREHLLIAWLGQDPDAALAFCRQQAPEDATRLLRALMKAWVKLDPEAALAAARQVEAGPARDATFESLVQTLSKIDPARAYRILGTLESEQQRNLTGTVIMEWARIDPGAARQAVGAMPVAQRMFGETAYFSGRSLANRNAAFQEAFALDPGYTQRGAVSIMMAQWLRQDMDGAFQFLAEKVPAAIRGEVASLVIWNAARQDPRKTLEWVAEHTQGRTREQVMQQTIARLAEVAPEEAAAFIGRLPYGSTYEASVEALAEEWALSDPAAAVQWIRTLDDGPERRKALGTATAQLVEQDPEGALDYAMTLTNAGERKTVFAAVATRKAATDPVAALGWAETLADDARADARERVILAWANNAPDAMARHFSTRSNERFSADLSEAIANEWSKQDAAGAAAWALGLEDAEARWRAVNRATGIWLRQDSYAASQWIEQMPVDRAREEAVENIVELIGPYDPESALAWAAGMQEPERRQLWTQKAVQALKAMNPSTVRAAVIESGLPGDEQATLLEFIGE